MTTSSSSQVITEYGKQNIFGRETQPQLVEDYTSYPEEAEKTNGRWAMIGMVRSDTMSPEDGTQHHSLQQCRMGLLQSNRLLVCILHAQSWMIFLFGVGGTTIPKDR